LSETHSARELDERIERGDPFFVLDVRHREESEAFPLEGRTALPGRNVPDFEMLEAGDSEDLVDSVASYAKATLGRELPRNRPVLAMCAKGGTSALVTQALHRLGYEAPARGCLGYLLAAGSHTLVDPARHVASMPG
jgi:rhodanese-related sulfurtransferase